MDFKGIWDKIKEKLSPLVEKAREFYEENKMLSYIIVGLVALLFLCIILLIVLTGKKKEPEVIPGTVLELTAMRNSSYVSPLALDIVKL